MCYRFWTSDDRAMDDSTEQEKTIARVVLAGWRVEPINTNDLGHKYYVAINPQGKIIGWTATRYAAALHAEQRIWREWDDVRRGKNGLLPETS